MNPTQWLSLAGIIVQLLIGAFIYGRLTGTVTGHAERLKALDDEQGRQWETLGRHGERISGVEAKVQSMEQQHRG